MANKIIHKHSVQVVDGAPKLPTSNIIEYGELAINYADGFETLSLKNTNDEIVEFRSKEYYENIIVQNELVTATALTDLDNRVNENVEILNNISESLTPLSESVSELTQRMDDTDQLIKDNEYVTALALTELDERVVELEENVGIQGIKMNGSLKETVNGVVDLGTVITDISNKADNTHSHGKITLSGDVTGSATIGSGTTAINITATVANDSHSHISSNISDTISSASDITSSANGLVQGKAVESYAAKKEHTHEEFTYLDNRITEIDTIIEDNEYTTALALTNLQDVKEDKTVISNETETTKTISPNKFYIWGTVSSLSISLEAPENENVYNEYMFQFTSGTNATTFSLPSTVKVMNDVQIESEKTYQVSIVNNLAIIAGF